MLQGSQKLSSFILILWGSVVGSACGDGFEASSADVHSCEGLKYMAAKQVRDKTVDTYLHGTCDEFGVITDTCYPDYYLRNPNCNSDQPGFKVECGRFNAHACRVEPDSEEAALVEKESGFLCALKIQFSREAGVPRGFGQCTGNDPASPPNDWPVLCAYDAKKLMKYTPEKMRQWAKKFNQPAHYTGPIYASDLNHITNCWCKAHPDNSEPWCL